MKKTLTALQNPQEYLIAADPVLAHVVKKISLPPLAPAQDHFRSLVESIISQQLSVKVADTIFNRFIHLFPHKNFPSPEEVVILDDHAMRGIGLSGQKAAYIKNLAHAAQVGTVHFDYMHLLSDEEIIAQLTQVKGIGRWTAEMFLMFSLARPDVFSYGDLGLRNAMKRLYKLRKEPSPRRALQISNPWRPYRTTACRYLWASLSFKD